MQARSLSLRLAAALSFVLVAQASAASFDFQYGSTVTPSPINPTATVGGPGSQVSQEGVGNFASPAAPTLNAGGPLGTDIIVGTISVTDLAIGSAYTDTYGPTTIDINLKIKDVTSSGTGVFLITGSLTGTVSSDGNAQSSVFNNPFLPSSQTLKIGSTFYTVDVIPDTAFVAPGAPPEGGTGLAGEYGVNVRVTAQGVPTPASALAGSALIAGLGAWRLIRRVGRQLVSSAGV